MEALKEEIEKMENETQEVEPAEVVEEATEEPAQEEVSEEVEADTEEATEEESEDDKTDEEAKREAYRERQRQKREKAGQQKAEAPQAVAPEAKSEDEALKAELELIRQERQARQMQSMYAQAEKELEVLEDDFREAFTDYDDVVNGALEFAKMDLVNKGLSEREANEHLSLEKIKIADMAAAQGKDPVEAVYNEAKNVLTVIDAYAEKMGYVKPEKPKTNLQAAREMSKPNAMTGGTGKGATAARQNFEDMDASEVGELTIEQMLKLSDNGEL